MRLGYLVILLGSCSISSVSFGSSVLPLRFLHSDSEPGAVCLAWNKA